LSSPRRSRSTTRPLPLYAHGALAADRTPPLLFFVSGTTAVSVRAA
jgi:hypothetical protein